MQFEVVKEHDASQANIKVVGVGGGGGNAINRMIAAQLAGVEFITINTDAQSLRGNQASTRIQVGSRLTHGLGAGADPIIGKQAAIEDRGMIEEALEGADMVFITSGMGGGTGTGASPVVAEIAKNYGALTIGIVTRPFSFEGKHRHERAIMGIQELREQVDSLITVPNQKLVEIADENMSMLDAFRLADDILRQGVQSISDLITMPGLINLDFADVRTIMQEQGAALMGVGESSGEERAVRAAEQAIQCPLLEDTSMLGAHGVIINISGGSDLSLFEVNRATSIIEEAADDDANIIFGAVIDNEPRDEVTITVIATGFESGIASSAARVPVETVAPDVEPGAALELFSGDLDVPAYLRHSDQVRPSPGHEEPAPPQAPLPGRAARRLPREGNLEIPTFLRRRGRNTQQG